MRLELAPLEKAIQQLDKNYNLVLSDIAKTNLDVEQALRMAAIQAFEFTYEISFKMMKRHLELTEANPESLDGSTFQDIIRLASERGLLLGDLSTWMGYRKLRGTTSHTYDEAKALEVFEGIPAFTPEAKHLLEKLKEKSV